VADRRRIAATRGCLARLAGAALVLAALSTPAHAVDDGSQMASRFRIDYLGYLQHADKVALFLSEAGSGSKAWELVDAAGKKATAGVSRDYVAKDFASGDSFYRVDFSSFSGTGRGFRLSIEGRRSEPFDIVAANPYPGLAEASFGYFEKHRTASFTFDRFLHDWSKGGITGGFWNDAGDKGFYTTNTAMAAWFLMNLYERYPESNASFASGVTLYDEVVFGSDLTHKVILPGQSLAVPKLHTNVPAWGPCPSYTGGSGCISRPETKATFAVARTLAQLARLHLKEKHREAARADFESARRALADARTEPRVCLGFDDFGGEGGIYPDNDNYSIWRDPKKPRDPCHPGRDNVEDDEFAALVEVFLTADALGDASAPGLGKEVAAHPRFGDISEFWWAAVAPTGNLSLLTLRPKGIDLARIRASLFRYADSRIENMGVGYPGVTKDARSNRWDSGDQDQVDNNWRWGSNRLLLDDAIVLAVAAEEASGDRGKAALYARRALRVMDYILGTNAMALSMVTGFGENAVERVYDCCGPKGMAGNLALGPNDWTNADDPDMPAFGSLPGMKMMPVRGTGWAAREIAIDGNSPLVWMAWWAEHRAPRYMGIASSTP
jgi:endoglucanase